MCWRQMRLFKWLIKLGVRVCSYLEARFRTVEDRILWAFDISPLRVGVLVAVQGLPIILYLSSLSSGFLLVCATFCAELALSLLIIDHLFIMGNGNVGLAIYRYLMRALTCIKNGWLSVTNSRLIKPFKERALYPFDKRVVHAASWLAILYDIWLGLTIGGTISLALLIVEEQTGLSIVDLLRICWEAFLWVEAKLNAINLYLFSLLPNWMQIALDIPRAEDGRRLLTNYVEDTTHRVSASEVVIERPLTPAESEAVQRHYLYSAAFLVLSWVTLFGIIILVAYFTEGDPFDGPRDPDAPFIPPE